MVKSALLTEQDRSVLATMLEKNGAVEREARDRLLREREAYQCLKSELRELTATVERLRERANGLCATEANGESRHRLRRVMLFSRACLVASEERKKATANLKLQIEKVTKACGSVEKEILCCTTKSELLNSILLIDRKKRGRYNEIMAETEVEERAAYTRAALHEDRGE